MPRISKAGKSPMAGEPSEYQKGRTYVSDKKKKSMLMGSWIGGEKPDYPKKSTELLLVYPWLTMNNHPVLINDFTLASVTQGQKIDA
jgi:hypothetical protein